MTPFRVAGLFWLLICCTELAAAGLRVDGAWVREPPPVAGPVAAYFDLVNESGRAVVLTGASSEAASSVQLHETRQDGDMARMRHLQEVRVPAGGRVRFTPGGRHLMIFGLQRIPRRGEMLNVRLQFADGDCLQISLPVLPSRNPD